MTREDGLLGDYEEYTKKFEIMKNSLEDSKMNGLKK